MTNGTGFDWVDFDGGGALDELTLETLMKSPEYLDGRNPRHGIVKARVNEHFKAAAGDNVRSTSGHAVRLLAGGKS